MLCVCARAVCCLAAVSPAPSAWDTHPQFAISRAASIQVPHTRRSQDISRVSGITGPIAAAALTLPQPPPPAPRKSTPLPDPVLSEQGSLTQPLLTNQCDETASEAPGYTDGPGAPTGPIQPALAPGWASEQKTAPAWPPTSPLRASVFGLINTAVGLPALIALTAIVYKDPVYTPYLGSLCKFFFFASGVSHSIHTHTHIRTHKHTYEHMNTHTNTHAVERVCTLRLQSHDNLRSAIRDERLRVLCLWRGMFNALCCHVSVCLTTVLSCRCVSHITGPSVSVLTP